jgi:Tfp pilus assembly protein PilZ
VAWRRPGRNLDHVRAGVGVAFAFSEKPKLSFLFEQSDGGSPVKSRRRYERVKLTLPVVWRAEGLGEPVEGTLRDVGRGGAFVRTKQLIDSNTEVVLEVSPPGAAVAMSFAGRVAWINRSGDDLGFGLEWRARDAGGGRRIKELVRRLSALSGVELEDRAD